MKKYVFSLLIATVSCMAFFSQTQAMTIACTMEAKLCPDGVTSVSRSGPNCEFAACPTSSSPSPGIPGVSPGNPGVGGFACTEEAKTCSDGTTVWRVGPNCEFMACPNDGDTPIGDDPVMCTMDAKVCSDGSSVGRVGPNCEFAACPGDTKPKICTQEYNPVCGQPKQTNPLAGISAPKTYSNKCVMESQGATLVNKGKCMTDFGVKIKQSVDIKVEALIEKIEQKLSDVSKKKQVIDTMVEKLESKVQKFSHIEGVIRYIQEKLQDYKMQL